MRVVVAGSSGFLGTLLVSALRRADHEVVRLVRRSPTAPDEFGWDPPAGWVDTAALEGADAVVNLCGAGVADKRWSAARKQLLKDSRIEPTEVLATAVAEHGVPILLNASAAGYYGDTGDRVVDESAPAGTGFLAGLCRGWEAATQAAADAGVRVVRFRTGLVLAPSGGLLGRMRPVFALMLGGKFGDGRQYMPWIHVDDVISGFRFALERESLRGPVNLGSPHPATNEAFTKELGAALGRPAPWTVPRFALRAALGELADEALLSSQRMVPRALRDNGFEFRFPILREALASVTRR